MSYSLSQSFYTKAYLYETPPQEETNPITTRMDVEYVRKGNGQLGDVAIRIWRNIPLYESNPKEGEDYFTQAGLEFSPPRLSECIQFTMPLFYMGEEHYKEVRPYMDNIIEVFNLKRVIDSMMEDFRNRPKHTIGETQKEYFAQRFGSVFRFIIGGQDVLFEKKEPDAVMRRTSETFIRILENYIRREVITKYW